MAPISANIQIPLWKTAEWLAKRLDQIIAERRADTGDELTEYQRGVLDGLDMAVKAMRSMADNARRPTDEEEVQQQ